MKGTTKHLNIRKVPDDSQFSCLIYAESGQLAVYVLFGESYRLAISYNCGAKPLSDARIALPSPMSFQPLAQVQILSPCILGTLPIPKSTSALTHADCTRATDLKQQYTQLPSSSQSVVIFLHWYLLPCPPTADAELAPRKE